MGRKRLMTEVQTFEAKTLYEKGRTLKELAVRYGVTGPTIRNEIASLGVTLRSRGRRKT